MPVYEQYVKPKRQPDRVSDMVPWRAIVAPGVVVQKDRWQSLQRTYAVRVPDLMGLALERLPAILLDDHPGCDDGPPGDHVTDAVGLALGFDVLLVDGHGAS